MTTKTDTLLRNEFNGYVPKSEEEAEFLRDYKATLSQYPITNVTVDLACFTHEPEPSVLLIKRGGWPFKGMWALPGGFMGPDETAMDAAKREVLEETGIITGRIEFLKIADAPNRDPRNRTVSLVHTALLHKQYRAEGQDDAVEAAWWPLNVLPYLAFDHESLVREAAELWFD